MFLPYINPCNGRQVLVDACGGVRTASGNPGRHAVGPASRFTCQSLCWIVLVACFSGTSLYVLMRSTKPGWFQPIMFAILGLHSGGPLPCPSTRRARRGTGEGAFLQMAFRERCSRRKHPSLRQSQGFAANGVRYIARGAWHADDCLSVMVSSWVNVELIACRVPQSTAECMH